MKTKLFFATVAFFALAITGYAQSNNNNANTKTPQNSKQTTYVDDNKNGVCDNFENRTKLSSQGNTIVYGQRNGQGRRYGYGNWQCRRRGNRAGQANGYCLRNGNGQGKGYGNGQFIDANKNGICDNKE